MKYRIKYVLRLEGYLDVEADSQDEAVETVEDSPLADLVDGCDLSEQFGRTDQSTVLVDEVLDAPSD